MTRIVNLIEALLFAARWLLVPVYLAMIVLLGMLVVYFLFEIAHAIPSLLQISEKDLILLTLSLIDLSLSANLVVLVILSGYENFVSRVTLSENDNRPEWLSKIDFSGLKLKILGSITVIAAVHLLGDFLDPNAMENPIFGWRAVIVVVFALLGLIFAVTDKLGSDGH
jgi:uncharacterized protein (TIGR00645 family)